MDVAIFRRADGSLRILTPADPTIPIAVVVAQAKQMDQSLAADTHIGNADIVTLPTRRFRAAWRIQSGAIGVNVANARAQVIAELRIQRDKILAQSDAMRLKYDEIGTAQQKTDVQTYRQSLRDLPSIVQADLSAMTTVAQLEAYVAPIPPLPAGISL